MHNAFVSRLICTLVGFIGLLLFCLLSINALNTDIWVTNYTIDYNRLATTSLMISVAMIAFVIYNVLITKILQYVFTLNRSSVENYAAFAFDSLTDLGVMLFFVSFLETYTVLPNNHTLLWLGVVFILVFVVKITIGAFQYFSFRGNHLYRFFLYLCTLEILPILVLIKYLSAIII